MVEETLQYTISVSAGTERCLGPVRWVPLSSFQAHRRKLQQLYEVVEYRDGEPWLRREEWRDVPDEPTIP